MLSSTALCDIIMMLEHHAAFRSIIRVEVVALCKRMVIDWVENCLVGGRVNDVVGLHASLLIVEEGLGWYPLRLWRAVRVGGVLEFEAKLLPLCDVQSGDNAGGKDCGYCHTHQYVNHVESESLLKVLAVEMCLL